MKDELGCVFCNKVGSSTGFKGKWICDECFPELYEIFKVHYYVQRVQKITDVIEGVIKKYMGEVK